MQKNCRISFRRICVLLLLVFSFDGVLFAQTFNNEWINYNNTYYKFSVGKDSLYRISKSTLTANGLGAISAEHFRLYRNGKEVAIYTSVPMGQLPDNGYIEFWGLANDGESDRELYRNPAYQHSTKFNLHSDSAAYFLTVETSSTNKRFTDVANDLSGSSIPPEAYFYHKAALYFKEQINPGLSANAGENVYSSAYDRGEFWSSWELRERETRTISFPNLRAIPNGPDATLRYGAFGNTGKTRRVRVALNNTQLEERQMDFYTDMIRSVSFQSSLLSSGSASVAVTDVQPPKPAGADPYLDRMVLSFIELTYAREFDFDGKGQFYFEMEPRTDGYYFEIRNFNSNGIAPVLYDLETQERYTGNIEQTGLVRFRLNGSSRARKMVVVNQSPAYAAPINTLKERKFVNYSNAGVQGNYIFISNPKLSNGASGSNPVEEYRAYRSSAVGGSYNGKVYDIHELTDQFAFGTKGHPSSIRNFLRYAKANFSQGISKVLLLGKGVNYTAYRNIDWNTGVYTDQPELDNLNLVPTFGFPGSDNILTTSNITSSKPELEIGRISVISASELTDYLEKVKEYEELQRSAPNTVDARLWMKNMLHITGASSSLLAGPLCNFVNKYKNIIEDTLAGARVEVLCKDVSGEVDQSGSQRVRELFEEGLSMVTYFGHSSSTTLEFSIENPDAYNNTGKYPVFSVNGCDAGDFFRYSPQRLIETQTLTEKFTLARQKGGIAFIASTHFGLMNFLDTYLEAFYKRMGVSDYGATLGRLMVDALDDMSDYYGDNYFARTHTEQISLHGDPALVMNFQEKPDYVIEESLIQLESNFISISDQNFKLKVKFFNLGKAVGDSLHVQIKRTNADGTSTLVYDQKRPAVLYADSLEFTLPVNALTDKGQNNISVVLDGIAQIPEMDEGNNAVSKNFFIFEDELTPVFPYQYAIVSNPAQKLFASTADPFSGMKQYVMEIDTTELFSSPLKKTITLSSEGGLLEFDPQLTYSDSTVYYWRTALVPAGGQEYFWNTTSFFFRNTQQEGFTQSHFFQHLNSGVEQIFIDTVTRHWKFGNRDNDLFIRQATYPTASNEQADFAIIVNNEEPTGAGCIYDELIFHVFDRNTFKLWDNKITGGVGLYNSYNSNCGVGRAHNFEYRVHTRDWRKRAMDFIDLIPEGSYVLVRNNNNPEFTGNTYPDVWRADTAAFGSGNSLYHKLLDQGFTQIDSFNRSRAWVFFFRKNDRNGFTPVMKFSTGIYDKLAFGIVAPTPQTSGIITSPAFGPAKQWKSLRWNGSQVEEPGKDEVKISIIGLKPDNSETILKEIGINEKNVDISEIDARLYPFLKLRMVNTDTTNNTPYQLQYWRLIYDPVPEGAVAPNLFFNTKDTVELGEQVSFGIAFKNVSKVSFDSLKVKVIITDKDNVPHELPLALMRPLISGDTIRFQYSIDTKNFPGANTIYIDFNPDGHQPEQYHFNNFIFRNLFVKGDEINPLMDVTFDGTHILSGDIVSARPHIQIKLKDESKFRLLNDTSLMTVKVKYPNGVVKQFRFDNDTVRFTPAVNTEDNTATIDFRPSFTEVFNEEGDFYELIVSGKDASDNPAGKIDYSVEFMVISKPMISNLLNYPNPFTTSTAFVFTLTGTEVPTNFKIQILTVTGKIVKEITGAELGPIRIGRNITEYKWDGTDQFGQRLANGVYLYRVITTLNGKKMDKYKAEGDRTDQFFNRGYGKMYLMR